MLLGLPCLNASSSPVGIADLQADASYIAGEEAEEKRDYEKALQFYQDAEDRFPTEQRIFEKIGNCYLKLERYANAVRTYERGLQHSPESTLLLNNLAVACRLNGQYELAIENYKKVLAVDPKDDAAWFFLGCSLMALLKNAEAEDAFLRSAAITPDVATTWFNLGIVCERQEKAHDALLHFARAIRLDPKDKDTWTRFRSLMDSDGPHAPYVTSWLVAPDDHDLDAYRKRAQKKAEEVAEMLFPRLRDESDPMWETIRISYRTIKENNPDMASSPSIVLFCAIVAGEKHGIPPNLPELGVVGYGEMTIHNGTGDDALIKVVSLTTDKLWRTSLAKAGEKIIVQNVPDGHYLIFFALAKAIDGVSGRLSEDAHASRFEKAVLFSTASRLDETTIKTTTTRYSLTLHPVIGGDARTKDVTIEEFNRY